MHFLANFLEVCRLNHHGCPWSLRRITNESRVGELTGGLHPDYQASVQVQWSGLPFLLVSIKRVHAPT